LKRERILQIGVLVLLSAFAVSLFAGTAEAITNGTPDGTDHPYVCLVVFDWDHDDDASTDPVPGWRTTGILLSPTVVLTAGHGTDGAVAARVWFEPGPIPAVSAAHPYVLGEVEYPYGGDTSFEGVPSTMPGFGYYLTNAGLPGFVTCDVGIVDLSEPVPTSVVSEYGQLPEVGEVNTLRVRTYVDLVGYGVQYQVTPRNNGGPYEAWRGDKTRYFAQAQLLSNKFAISDRFLMTTANPAQGKGGTAFGDSGGPVFKQGTSTILAITSFGANSNCAGTGYYYRIDQTDVQDFIDNFLE
jgi:hypothetical protein